MRWVVLALAASLTAGCAAAPVHSGAQVPLTIKGGAVLDARDLQTGAEAELDYALGFGYVARTSGVAVSCWFARVGTTTEVDTRLWCGPVQVPGTAAVTDWVPVPLKEVDRSAAGVRLEVQPPQVPEQGSRSTPVGRLVRTDGRETEADQGVGEAGPDFLAVLPDDGRPIDPASARVRDDQLDVRVTGYGSPAAWPTDQGDLRAGHGVRLRVLRLRIDRLGETDSAFLQTPWRGWLPQAPELGLEVPGRRHPLTLDRLPESGSVFVVYTVPEAGGGESLVLDTVGAKSLRQAVEVPSGKALTDVPSALRRAAGPDQPVPVSAKVGVNGAEGVLEVQRVRLGRQRPVSAGGQYELATASGPDRALLELRLLGRGLPSVVGASATKGLLGVRTPDGGQARVVGVRYGGDTFPVALVVEVPADVRSVTFTVASGTVVLPMLGTVPVTGGDPVTVPLDF